MNLSLLKQKVRLILATLRFARGIQHFRKNGETPMKSYYAMRDLYSLTNGRSNDLISWLQMLRHPKNLEVIPSGILGKLSNFEVKNIAAEIKKNGYYISSNKIDLDTANKIVKFCKTTPVEPLGINSEDFQDFADKKVIFNPLYPISPIYRFNMKQVFENLDLLSLILDKSLLAVAQEYLGCTPVLDLVALWWSVAFNGKGTSEAAQEFHYDMDRIKFLKIFIYLTDVNSENGPHCYVKGSHIRKPKALLSDGRKSDSEIKIHYSESQINELHGSQGTIILADTRGFHKGKPLVSGYRLIFQLEYSNSLFGQNYPKVRLDDLHDASELKKLIEKYPRTYGQIFKGHLS